MLSAGSRLIPHVQRRMLLPALSILLAARAGAAAVDPSCGGHMPPAAGYTCVAGFCGCEAPMHPPPPACGPVYAELKLGGSEPAEKVQRAKQWCNGNKTCTGFAVDPHFATTLAFAATNFTATAQPNSAWSLYWKGDKQWPLPPRPPPGPPPSPPSPPSPGRGWQPILPRGPCETDEHCSLNGVCDAGACVCTASWRGHNCQHLALQPVPKVAGYGWAPNITS